MRTAMTRAAAAFLPMLGLLASVEASGQTRGGAATSEAPPRDIGLVFAQICMSNGADPRRVEAAVALVAPGTRPLPTEATQQLQGATGGVAWALRASGARLLVEMTPAQVCAVRALTADTRGVEREVASLVSQLADSLGSRHKVVAEIDQPLAVGQGTLRHMSHKIEIKGTPGSSALVSVTTTSPAGAQRQSVLSFSLVAEPY